MKNGTGTVKVLCIAKIEALLNMFCTAFGEDILMTNRGNVLTVASKETNWEVFLGLELSFYFPFF